MQQLTDTTHHMVGETHDMQAITNELRDHIADFEDFFRPIRSYFYWEKHCYDIPICWSLRSIFDSIDGVDEISDKLKDLVADLDQIDVLLPQLLTQFPQMIAIMQSMRTMMLTMHSTMSGTFGEMDENSTNATAMGKAFDTAKNDDSFYLPPEVFKNPDFKRVMKVFLSPDGKAVRMFISQKDDPASPEGISRVDSIKSAAEEALKGTPLEDSKIYLTGTAAMVKDMVDGSKYDLMIAGVAALCLIFIIMLIITRSFIAALVIVGTVLLSLGASFGLSVLVWQYFLGIQIHWAVLVMSVIVLLAVGSDYNLLLVSRMKEEIGAGINTGIIRAMGGTGKVVTNAGLVFAFTMASMVVSDLRSIGQVGTTIGLGLLFDTLVVRAFMTPSIAALLGRWFWWPQQVRPRPASALLRPVRTPSVGACLVAETAAVSGGRCGQSRDDVARSKRLYEHRTPPFHSADDPQAFGVHHPGLGGADSDCDSGSSIAGAGRPRAFRTTESQRRAVGAGHVRMGKDFKESDSDSFAMIVLEGQQRLGDDAHTYYAGLVRELRDDREACRACAGFMGRSTHGGGRAKR